jgi:L-ascorbate metabolism protein UlaG (beta-lactamase superfamily)
MHIQYLGFSSFKFITKDATVVTDPYGKGSGLTPPRGNADIIVLAESNNELYSSTSSFSGTPFLIDSPGEYDKSGVTVTGIPLKQESGYITIFLLESEDLKILNLAHIKDFNIKESELEELGEIDILILPIGGHNVLGASDAAKVVNQIEPKIIIPSHYAAKGIKIELDPIDRFIKEMGNKHEELEKLIIKKKDIMSTEEIRLVVLTA